MLARYKPFEAEAAESHNVLGHAGESEDETRTNRDQEDSGDLYNSGLCFLPAPCALTFRAKAMPALVKRTKRPTLCSA